MRHSLQYLAPGDIARCGIDAREVTQAVARAFLAKAAGRACTGPKLALPAVNGASFSAKGAVLADEGLAVMKWYGYVPHNERRGLPDYSPLVIVSSSETGLPLALIDGHWLTAVRTAAISCAAASRLARPEAASVGFIACGSLARAHLDALQAHFPLERVRCWSRKAESAKALAEKAGAMGLDAQAVAQPEQAVQGMDIVVSSVPRQAHARGLLDAGDLAPGSFAAMACMGYSWQPESLYQLDLLASDDADPETRCALEPVAWSGAFDADLAQLLAGPPLWREQARSAIMFAGSGIADAAAAALIWRRANENGFGHRLAFGACPHPTKPTATGANT